MRYLILIFLTLSQFACHSKDNKGMVDPRAKSATMNGDSVFGGHPISFYISHKKIPQVCKDLFNGVLPPSDEIDVLSLLDSVLKTNDETGPFYFLTITRTMKNADGAYAEAVGMMGKLFVETKTKEFVDYFNSERLLTDKDFEEWAKTVAGEIEIAAEEGHEKEELGKMRTKMKLNCRSCNEGQIKIMNDFVEIVRQWLP